jgi:hypothetical protein
LISPDLISPDLISPDLISLDLISLDLISLWSLDQSGVGDGNDNNLKASNDRNAVKLRRCPTN